MMMMMMMMMMMIQIPCNQHFPSFFFPFPPASPGISHAGEAGDAGDAGQRPAPGEHVAPADDPGACGAQGDAPQRGQLHGSHAAGDAGPGAGGHGMGMISMING